eukprot:CAMPEP_0198249014 /NCGR_PEP_ID=MMETSP1447-20131203/647_1 /TAXON_ID=420782 /ORGANISM="Chaetoceros dichaeta, Strain CCMP1751" /LENGTH=266 /DNA_ID=CAMNT_0043933539 /DNA_START=79 /DNA_END=875 /DNA_ORIENTATION=+
MPPGTARIRNLGDGDEPGATPSWIDSLPIITKHWFGATLVITLLANFNVIPVHYVMWSFPLIKDQFQLWRFLTPFLFVGDFSFPTAITLMLLYQYSSQYEKSSVYNTGAGGGTADYVTMLLFGMATTLLSNCVMAMTPFYSKNMVYYVLYVWSKRNPTAQASIWGLPVGAAMLPFAVLGINVIMGNPWLEIAHGCAMGHLYYFLVDIVPQVYGKDYLHTPDYLINFFGTGEYVAPAPAMTTTASGGQRSLGAMGSSGGGGGRPVGG